MYKPPAPDLVLEHAARPLRVFIDLKEEFEAATRMPVAEVAQFMTRDLRDVWAMRISRHRQHNIWSLSFSEGLTSIKGYEYFDKLYFELYLTNQRWGYCLNMFPINPGRGEGSAYYRNWFEFLIRLQVPYASINSVDLGSYVGYRSGGRPAENFMHQTEYGAHARHHILKIAEQLTHYQPVLSSDTFNRIAARLQEAHSIGFEKNPLLMAEIASEKEIVDGKPIGFQLLNNKSGYIIWDLGNPIVRDYALNYFNHRIKNRPPI